MLSVRANRQEKPYEKQAARRSIMRRLGPLWGLFRGHAGGLKNLSPIPLKPLHALLKALLSPLQAPVVSRPFQAAVGQRLLTH